MVTGGAFPSPREAAGRRRARPPVGSPQGGQAPRVTSSSQILRHSGRRVWEEKQSIHFVVFEKSNVEKDLKRSRSCHTGPKPGLPGSQPVPADLKRLTPRLLPVAARSLLCSLPQRRCRAFPSGSLSVPLIGYVICVHNLTLRLLPG